MKCTFLKTFCQLFLSLSRSEGRIHCRSHGRPVIATPSRPLNHPHRNQFLDRVVPPKGTGIASPVKVTFGAMNGGLAVIEPHSDTQSKAVARTGRIGWATHTISAEILLWPQCVGSYDSTWVEARSPPSPLNGSPQFFVRLAQGMLFFGALRGENDE